MEIKALNERPSIDQNSKLHKLFNQFELLIGELNKKDLPNQIVDTINIGIDEINAIPDGGKALRAQIKKTQSSVIRLLEKELKLVAKNHYRNTWLVLGMTVFGLPMGVVFGLSLGNVAFLGIGLPIGMAVGIALGTGMDKKAFEEGRQLNLEIKY